MNWLVLICAGGFEIVGVAGFERLTRRIYISGLLLGVGGFGLGLACLHYAMQSIPMAVAYGVFTGVGAVGSTALGIFFWGDSARPARLFCIALIVIAVIGLKTSY
ncbi:SugE protein [Salinisphaera shabanensis E1L3A]|uniref:Guanidinium exporter n=1 Tax=Salinisphaera shabanensis E1L3A TaxID=1033802 RepID=U2EPP9_9GAMM|nr:SMR family transporter [Salinisphaera shabanensis]ERJ20037.1 SugE protein [Salinisphaera shabanensis E1L3A]